MTFNPKFCPSYSFKIYCGLKEGYDGKQHTVEEVYTVCQEYCNTVKLGLTVTPTKFVYVNGMEDGVIIGLVNYPRFPKAETEIREIALDLGVVLMETFNQERITIEGEGSMLMIEREELNE